MADYTSNSKIINKMRYGALSGALLDYVCGALERYSKGITVRQTNSEGSARKESTMLSQPDALLEIARLQQQDLMQRAERRRLLQELERSQPGWLQRISRSVIGAGQQVKLLIQFNLARPVFLARDSSSHGC